MGQRIVVSSPVRVTLEWDDDIIDTFIDDEGTHDVYLVKRVLWEEISGNAWLAVVIHPSTGKGVEQLIEAFESGSKNLPTPTRFNSYPITTHITLNRA